MRRTERRSLSWLHTSSRSGVSLSISRISEIFCKLFTPSFLLSAWVSVLTLQFGDDSLEKQLTEFHAELKRQQALLAKIADSGPSKKLKDQFAATWASRVTEVQRLFDALADVNAIVARTKALLLGPSSKDDLVPGLASLLDALNEECKAIEAEREQAQKKGSKTALMRGIAGAAAHVGAAASTEKDMATSAAGSTARPGHSGHTTSALRAPRGGIPRSGAPTSTSMARQQSDDLMDLLSSDVLLKHQRGVRANQAGKTG
jgi:hypothetical protein